MSDLSALVLSTSFISSVRQRVEQSKMARAIVPLEDVGKLDCSVVKKEVSEPREVADELRDCWYKTGERNNRMGYIVGLIDDKEIDFCIVCSEITPTVDLGTGGEQGATAGIAGFLAAKTIRDGPGKDKRYKEYLDTSFARQDVAASDERAPACSQTGWCYFLNPVSRARARHEQRANFPYLNTLEEGKLYYVISLSSGISKERFIELFNAGLSPGEEAYNHVFVVPADKVQNIQCDAFHYQAQ